MGSQFELRIKLGISGALGCVGFILSVASLYWLLRIRRTFRQQLLLLMIIADVAKSVAYVALPLAAWSGISVSGHGKYCQFSGFLMAMTVEGTDFTMVLISIHLALYVFQGHYNLGFGGLSEYRYIVYTLWALIPTSMASLAFINPNGGYDTMGASCYLPRNPYWYRLSLAMIPRCLVFLIILSVYSAIYFYIKRSLGVFREVENMSAKRALLLLHGKPDVSPSTPYKGCHALNTHNFGSYFKESDAIEGSVTRQEIIMPNARPDSGQFSSNFSGSGISATSSKPVYEEDLPTLSNLDERRLEIKRQLKLLFIYPIVYLLMWAAPMAFMALQLIKHWEYGKTPSWVSIAWGTILAAQPGVEVTVFLLRERPWTKERSPLSTWLRRFRK